jgi:hypothetical protein
LRQLFASAEPVRSLGTNELRVRVCQRGNARCEGKTLREKLKPESLAKSADSGESVQLKRREPPCRSGPRYSNGGKHRRSASAAYPEKRTGASHAEVTRPFPQQIRTRESAALSASARPSHNSLTQPKSNGGLAKCGRTAMRNYDNFPTPERMAEIEAHARKALRRGNPSDCDDLSLSATELTAFLEHIEAHPSDWNDPPPLQQEPPDRRAPPLGGKSAAAASGSLGDLVFHPAAASFRLMNETELTALADDLKTRDPDEDIVDTLDGMVLGGRNLYNACIYLRRKPRIRALSDTTDLLDYLISKNLMRRDLTKLERALFAARLVTTDEKHGGDRKSYTYQSDRDSRFDFVTPADAARRIGLSTDSVNTALYNLRNGIDDFIAAIDKGIPWMTLNFADKIAHSSEDDQDLWLYNHRHSIKPVKRGRRPPTVIKGITTATLNALSRDETGALVLRSIPKLTPEDALQAVKDALLLANQAAKREGKRVAILDLNDSNLGPLALNDSNLDPLRKKGSPRKEDGVDSYRSQI